MSDDCPVPADTANQPGRTAAAGPWRSWDAFIAAVRFLTQVSLPMCGQGNAAALSRSPVYFPLVGGLIGIVTSIVLGVACLFWPVWLAVIAALAIEARLTGAFHEDAVADFCDAFGGGWTRDDVLTILKDSRIGSFGALGLGLAVALRIGATIEIVQCYGKENWLAWCATLVAASAIARFVIVVVMIRVPPIPFRESVSRDIGVQLSGRDLVNAGLWMVPVVVPFIILSPQRAAICGAVLVPVVFWFTTLVRRRLGGITGDCLGCICYCSHIVVLLTAAARWQP